MSQSHVLKIYNYERIAHITWEEAVCYLNADLPPSLTEDSICYLNAALAPGLTEDSICYLNAALWQIVRAPDGQTHRPIKVDSMFPAGVFGPRYSRPLLHSFGAFQKAFSDEIVKILGKNLMKFHFHQRLLMSTTPEVLCT